MSKKITSTQSNTLFNYFKSPQPKSSISNVSSTSKDDNEESRPETTVIADEMPEESIQNPTKKRSRTVDGDSEKEDTELWNTPSTSSNTPSSSWNLTKKFKKESSPEDNTGGDNSVSSTSKKTENISPKNESANEVEWLHDKLEFLKPHNVRDENKRNKDDPEYDVRTLYVPENYLNTLTPAMRQWWILKSKHYDSVLFFKVGKFYELYHMDAVIGVNHLGFSYMKGEFAHSGFPEIAFNRMAESLMEQGFKVARVEQTETPDMMNERCKNKKTTKFDKVVNREICQITTKGSCVLGPQITDAKNPLTIYMLAIAEKIQNDNTIRYGVCFVDTSIGTFHMAEFPDDRHCSKLLVLLSEHPPLLVLTERNKTSDITYEILRRNAGNARIEKLSTATQFHSGESVIQKLQEGDYFKDERDVFCWPGILEDIIVDGGCKAGYELTMNALGACWWFLKDSLLDIQVLSMCNFVTYEPLNEGGAEQNSEYMILDAITMENLNVLGKDGTIQKTLDFCCTAFGKRLLHEWVCRPSCNLNKLKGRQNSVQELYSNQEWLESARQILKKLPDLDRQLMQIHTFGNKQFAERHPDSRAIFYERVTYFKRKIIVLLSTLKGFEKAMEIPQIFEGSQSRLLSKVTHFTTADGLLWDLSEPLNYFKEMFNQEEAEKTGKIIPEFGVDDSYDKAETAIQEVNGELDEYLKEQQEFFQCNVVYHGTDKKRYQLEVPEYKCNKVTAEYTLEGTKKGTKPVQRYSTARTKELLAKMLRAEHERANVIDDINRKIFEKFNDWYNEWDQVTRCLAMLDVLCSLAKYARTYSHDVCLPTLLPFSDRPFIKIENGRHPCMPNIDDYVPNDTTLGTKDKPGILILTGPNMGGKSTLMRQVALIIVMAQIGSYVPATSCELSLIDRIFTRLGAQDDIMSGHSTFLVEVSEASAILQHATKHSFVLLDELGRGTSTHDGNAIATAYMKKLLEINCRVIYSTHYHTLVEHYGELEHIQLGHMACMINEAPEGKPGEEVVTFLYKLEPGVCSNSYGFNVAKLAGLPSSIVERAREIADELQVVNVNRELFVQVFGGNDISQVKEGILKLKSLNT